MHYSGGFLLDQVRNLVLLHKRDEKTANNPSVWAFFGGLSENAEKPQDTFVREIKEELVVNLLSNEVKKLRDYFNPDFNTHRNVFYAEFDSTLPLELSEGEDTGWFSLDEAFELPLSKRTREDLVYFKESKD